MIYALGTVLNRIHAPCLRYITCTTDAETVWAETGSPAATPTDEGNGPTADTPAPTRYDTDISADTPAPTTRVDDGRTADTLAPTSYANGRPADTPMPSTSVEDIGAVDTRAPTNDTGGNSGADAPTAGNDDERNTPDAQTPAPSTGSARGIITTLSPIEEASPLDGRDAATLANGARGGGNTVAVGSAALSFAVGILACVAL